MSEKNQQIQWVTKNVRLSSLTAYERNPRTITDSQFQKLKNSIEEDGYHSRIKATHDFRVIGGHQRLKALKDLGYEEVEILVPEEEIDDDTFKRVLIRDNHSNGMFDMDMLANDFDLEELREFGIHDVMNIPPMFGEEDQDQSPQPERCAKCPECGTVFTTKGNME